MSRLRSTLINGNLTTTNTITIPQRNVMWIDGFKDSPIKITDSTDSSGYSPWLIQRNIAVIDVYSDPVYVSFGTYINDISLLGHWAAEYELHPEPESNDSNITVTSDSDLTSKEGLDGDFMVRWWFNVGNGEFHVAGNKYKLGGKNCYYINSNNYTNYMPSKTGSGASGTWGINISGNAASLSKVLPMYNGGTGGSSMFSGCILVRGNGAGIGTHASLKASDTTFGIDSSSSVYHRIYVENYYNTVDLHTNVNAGIWCDKSNKWLIHINTSGTVVANTSDRRRKLYIEDIPEDETKILLNVPIRNFVFKEDIEYNNLEQNGIFAQDLRELLKKNNIGNRPYLQWEYNDSDRDDVYYDINASERDDMTYSISYDHMIPALIKGWQMQNKEIEELEKKLAILRMKKLNGLSS